jgi:hypothetical protein
MRLLVHTFNAAVDTLPELPKARCARGESTPRATPDASLAAQGFTDRAVAEAAALPSAESQRLADEVQRAIAIKEEAKKKANAANAAG